MHSKCAKFKVGDRVMVAPGFVYGLYERNKGKVGIIRKSKLDGYFIDGFSPEVNWFDYELIKPEMYENVVGDELLKRVEL